jgi:hypothetical protein
VYSVEWEQHALDQLAALPSEAFSFYAELVALLEVAPWSGDSYDRQRPDANMRTCAFGEHGEGLIKFTSSSTISGVSSCCVPYGSSRCADRHS